MLGLDRFVKEYTQLRNTPIGVLSNHASLSSNGYPAACELLRHAFSVRKIFSPEHGITSQGEDGKEQPDGNDHLTGLPVVSLYGKTQHPPEKDLEDLDLILVDLPNIGCRFYTYWWTITCMLETCSNLGKKVMILDRPNLVGHSGRVIEGPMLDETNCSSFLGRWKMPLTYNYSYGQLARWFVRERTLSVPLHVVDYDQNTHASQIFVPTSPSMPDEQSALIYPCTGLFEGLNLNTGRGTSFPFRVIGAPWINALRLYEDFRARKFPGITAFPYIYRPAWSRYSGSLCNGLYFSVPDPAAFQPVHAGLWLMNYLSIHYADHLTPGLYPTVANPSGENHLDLLLGIQHAFSTICSGREHTIGSLDRLLDASGWSKDVDAYLGL